MRKQVTDTEILDAQAARLKGSMYHCMPGIVTAFYVGEPGRSPCTADVQPAINDVRMDTDTNERIPEAWPIIPRVPILYYKGGGFIVAGPLKAGDKVTLLSYDLDPTTHRVSGNQADPIDVRRHAGSYWACLPSDITDPGGMVSSNSLNNSMVIGVDGTGTTNSECQIIFDGTHVKLGGNFANDSVALASLIDSFVTVLLSTYTPAGPETGFAAFIAALQAWKISTWGPQYNFTSASSIVKSAR